MPGDLSGFESAVKWEIVAGLLSLLILVVCFLASLCLGALEEASVSGMKNESARVEERNLRAVELKTSAEKYKSRLTAGRLFCSVGFVLLAGYSIIMPLGRGFYSWLGQSAAAFGAAGQIAALLVFLVLGVFGFQVPEGIALGNPDGLLLRLQGILRVLSGLFFPFYAMCLPLLLLFGKRISRRERIQPSTENPTEEKILMMVDEGEENGTIQENTRSMIENVFEFDDTTVGEIMTHRKDIVAVHDDDTLLHLTRLAIESGRSRIPVYHEDIDDITGIIYVKDLLGYLGTEINGAAIDKSLIHEPVYVPESKRCSEMFQYMTSHKSQIAVVVDEFGGTGGIITMEDLIESILGNIQDEYDNEDEGIQKVNEYSFTVDGATSLDEIEDLTGISFESDDNDTIAGIMLDRMGHIPKKGEHPSIMINGTRFTVMEADQRRIFKILIVKNHSSGSASSS